MLNIFSKSLYKLTLPPTAEEGLCRVPALVGCKNWKLSRKLCRCFILINIGLKCLHWTRVRNPLILKLLAYSQKVKRLEGTTCLRIKGRAFIIPLTVNSQCVWKGPPFCMGPWPNCSIHRRRWLHKHHCAQAIENHVALQQNTTMNVEVFFLLYTYQDTAEAGNPETQTHTGRESTRKTYCLEPKNQARGKQKIYRQ